MAWYTIGDQSRERVDTMVTICITCRHCGSPDLTKYGIAPNGKQKYRCRTCRRQSRENPGSAAYTQERKEEILRAYQERSSLRGLERTFGVARSTVISWLRKKANKVWIWLALCRKTRQIVGYALGDRDEATCRKLWQSIPAKYRRGTCYTDFWDAYQAVIPVTKHRPVGKETGQTAHIERFNNTLRQRLARFVRKTLSFSKSKMMHEICLKLFIWRYNLEIRAKLSIL